MKKSDSKRRLSRLLGLLLAAVMVISAMPAFALKAEAANEYPATITVSFDANGGDGTMESVELVKKWQSDRPQLPVCTFTRDGYRFIGWTTTPDGDAYLPDYGGYWYDNGMTLYAVWARDSEVCRISFDSAGGVDQPDIYAKKNGTVVLPAPLKGKDNASFNLYRDDANDRTYTANSTISVGSEDMLLTMEWYVKDITVRGPAPEFANTIQWSKGLYDEKPEPGEYIVWNPGEPYLGWADVNQDPHPYCSFVAGLNGVHWWFDRNDDFVRYYTPFTSLNIDTQYRGETKSFLWEYFKWNAGYRMVMSLPESTASQWWIPGDPNADPNEVKNPYDKSHAHGGFFKEIFGVVGTNHRWNGTVTKASFTQDVVEGLKNDRSFYVQLGTKTGGGHAWTVWGFHFDSEGYVDGIYLCESNGADVPGDSVAEPREVVYSDGAVRLKGPLSKDDQHPGTDVMDLLSLPASRKVWNDFYLRDENGKKYMKMPDISKSDRPTAGQERTAGEFDLQTLLDNKGYGTIKLGKDISVSKNTTFTISRSVTLDLNGHTIKGNYGQPVLTVTGGENDTKIDVVIKDSSSGQNGKITGGHGTAEGTGGVLVSGKNTHLFFESGNITGNRGMYGGGIYVENGATVTMDGGKITNNRADTCVRAGLGGGVYVSGGSFVMNNGEISGNYSNSAGGGVAVGVCGQFIMKDGKITGNTTELDYSADIYGGGGVAAYAVGGQAKLLGGEITDNKAEGGASFGGGVLATYGGSVTVGNGVKISGNTENGKACNVLIDGDYEESFLKTENLSATEKIGVSIKGDKIGQFLHDTCSADNTASQFVSDNENYAVEGKKLTASKSNYSFTFDEDNLTVMHGTSVSVPVTVLNNGIPCASEGTVTLETNGKTAVTHVGSDGVAKVMGSPILGEYGWKIGKNKAKLIWKGKDGEVHFTKEVEFTYTRYCIGSDCVVWENADGRTEGDGKYLTARFKTSDAAINRKYCIPESDLGRVELILEGHRAQEAGTYVAKVVGVTGEMADYYQLEPNIWGNRFQKTYTIESKAGQYAMTLSPEEKKVSEGDELNMDVTVKWDGEYCQDGTVSLKIGSSELCSAELKKGMARLTFKAMESDLPVGRNTVTAHYTPKGQSEPVASVESVVEMAEGKLPKLEWNGTVKVSGKYGKMLWLMDIDTGNQTPTYKGNPVEGSWRFRSNEENTVPDCTGKRAYELFYQPATGEGEFAELSVMVVPEVEKMGQSLPAPISRTSHLIITPTSITLDYRDEKILTGKGGAPLEYALVEGFSYTYNGNAWQASPIFSGLKPDTSYSIFARFAETDNYKAGTAQSYYPAKTSAADMSSAVIDTYPSATGYYGQKLSEITPVKGKVTRNGQEIRGEWRWDDPSQTPAVGARKSYGVTFTSSDGNDTLSASIYPVIQKKLQNCESPQMSEHAVSWIELKAVEKGESGEAVMYGIVPKGQNGVNKAIWQEQPRFTGLEAGTGYEFYVKSPGNENYEDGISQGVTFSTVKRGVTTLAVNENVKLEEGALGTSHLVSSAKYGDRDAIKDLKFRWKPNATTQQEWKEGLPFGEGMYRVRISLPDYEDEVTETYYVGQTEEVIVRLGKDTTEPEVPDKPVEPDKPETITKGDVNEDGRVDLLDLRMVLRHICKKETLKGNALKEANMVGEEEIVDLLDLRDLLRVICKKS